MRGEACSTAAATSDVPDRLQSEAAALKLRLWLPRWVQRVPITAYARRGGSRYAEREDVEAEHIYHKGQDSGISEISASHTLRSDRSCYRLVRL